ncbi:uncharacterized protein [Clytia hemisphaerica]
MASWGTKTDEKSSEQKVGAVYQENIALRKKIAGESTDIEDGSVHQKKSKWYTQCKWQWLLWLLTVGTALIYIFYQKIQYPSSNVFSLKSDPLTLGKIENREIEICNSNQMKRSFPDLDYALYGYNILFGYPLAIGHDPGLTHPVFQADYGGSRVTADCRYQVPEGYDLVPDVSCVTSFSSQTVKNSRQFSKELSVSAEVSGGGWGVSFSASADYKKKESSMSASESVYVFSTASCNYYFSLLNENNPPKLTKDFVNLAKQLKTESDVFKFFNYYGTHFMTYTLFGARFVYENKMSQKSFKSESEEGVSVSVKASYSGLFSLGGGFGMSSSQRQAAEDFQSKVETKTISIGAPPPADGNTMTWASTVKDTPVPVRYKLESIENLFSSLYMRGENFDYDSTKKLVQSSKLKYCKELNEKGIVDSCKMVTNVISLIGLSVWGGTLNQLNRDRCEDKCLEDDRCIVLEYPAANQCWLFYHDKQSNVTLLGKASMPVPKGEEYGTFIFYDALKLLGHTLKIERIAIKPGQLARKNIRTNETDCSMECRQDQACAMVTFNRQAQPEENNCKLYSEDKFECPDDIKECHIIAYDIKYANYVTIFNP